MGGAHPFPVNVAAFLKTTPMPGFPQQLAQCQHDGGMEHRRDRTGECAGKYRWIFTISTNPLFKQSLPV